MSEFFLHGFNTLGHGFIGYVIPFLFVLTIVVFFHELGHFLAAKRVGTKRRAGGSTSSGANWSVPKEALATRSSLCCRSPRTRA